MNDICSFGVGPTDQEIVWSDVSMNGVLLVDTLDSGKLERLDKSQRRQYRNPKHTL